ncbi:MAG: hypothetical protein QF789_09405, partial [Gammaproteobacteria bacterium]|nr:hypothetical protein [Gammaproteobacteria bacterium]
MRLAIILLFSLLTPGVASADYDDSLSADIQAFLDIYAEAYNRQDYDTLLSMWDQDYPHPIYMAEEI